MLTRLAAKTDIEALLPLIEGYWHFEGFDDFDAARIRRNLDWLFAHPTAGQIHLAIGEDRPAGYLLLVYNFSLEHDGLMADIDEFFIEEAHRGQGLGARLLAAAEASAQDAGCKSLMLQVAGDNAAARAFYLDHGFFARTGFELLEKDLPGIMTDTLE